MGLGTAAGCPCQARSSAGRKHRVGRTPLIGPMVCPQVPDSGTVGCQDRTGGRCHGEPRLGHKSLPCSAFRPAEEPGAMSAFERPVQESELARDVRYSLDMLIDEPI